MIRMREILPGARATTVLIDEWVTGGGLVGHPLPASLAAEGAAIRRAVVADFAAVDGVRVVELIDARCLDPRAVAAAAPNVTPIIADPAHPIDLGSLADRADGVIVVAPETAGVLLGRARDLARSGGRSLGSTPEAIALASDKHALADHFAQVGVPTPPTIRLTPGETWPDFPSGAGRVVVKPSDGAGAVATFVLPTSVPRPAWLHDRAGFIVQPFRPGRVGSASFLVGPDGRAHLIAVGRQVVAVEPDGQVTYRGGVVPIPLTEGDLAPVRRAVESVPGLLGFVGVDFIQSEPTGAVEVIEINPRLTTSIVGLVQLAPPGMIARAWLDLVFSARNPDDDPDFRAIRSAPSVRFGADGSLDLARRTDS